MVTAEDVDAEFTVYALPKTVEAAVKLTKKANELEDGYAGPNLGSMGDTMTVLVDMSMLPAAMENKVYPKAVAEAYICWYASPGTVDDDGEEMIEEMKKELKKVGLNPNDYDYDFEVDEDWGFENVFS